MTNAEQILEIVKAARKSAEDAEITCTGTPATECL